MAKLGSIVQNGKFSAGTDYLEIMLNVELCYCDLMFTFPTLAIPTIPIRKLELNLRAIYF